MPIRCCGISTCGDYTRVVWFIDTWMCRHCLNAPRTEGLDQKRQVETFGRLVLSGSNRLLDLIDSFEER